MYGKIKQNIAKNQFSISILRRAEKRKRNTNNFAPSLQSIVKIRRVKVAAIHWQCSRLFLWMTKEITKKNTNPQIIHLFLVFGLNWLCCANHRFFVLLNILDKTSLFYYKHAT
jgi:hypothetical protein